MPSLPPEQHVRCEHCGHDRAEHYLCNVTDGQIVGKYFLVCPTAVFRARGFDVDGAPYKKGDRG